MELKNLQEIKRRSGIYFLIRGNNIVYIGQSCNVYTRILEHILEGKKTFDKVKSIYNDDELELELIEIFLISKVRPKYNKLIVPDTKLYYFALPNTVTKRHTYEYLLETSEKIYSEILELKKCVHIGD